MSTIESLYKFVKNLGEGTFGSVVLLERTQHPKIKVAVKEVCFDDEESKNQIESEFDIQHRLTIIGHVNIIKMCKITRRETYSKLYMEFADGGELGEKIGKDGMDMKTAKFHFRQIVEGLSFLHENGVVHRDIKPQNLLLTSAGVVKIADFGLSKRYRNEAGEEIKMEFACGTPPYFAPELFKNEPFRGPPTDVWSAGVVLVMMLTGGLRPWEQANEVELFKNEPFRGPPTDVWSAGVVLVMMLTGGQRPWEQANDFAIPYLLWKNGMKRAPLSSMDESTISFLKKIFTDDAEARATIRQVKDDSWLVSDVLPTPSLKRKTVGNENIEVQPKEMKRQRLEASDTSSDA